MFEKSGKKIAPLTLEELKVLAKNEPKVAVDDERPLALAHGVFYRRFLEMRAVALGYAEDSEITYVRMTKERFGIDLEAFYQENEELCEAICAAIDATSPYDTLLTSYQEMLRQEPTDDLPPGSADELIDATGHPRGLDAIGLYYLDQLNPLLEQAYALFDSESFNAPFLAR